MTGPANRRGFLSGLASVSVAASAGFALPALAAPLAGPVDPHPDQVLFDAEAEWLRADAAEKAAVKASGEAYRAFKAALGPCPDELILTPWEMHAFQGMTRRSDMGKVATYLIHRPLADAGVWRNPDHAWTARGLRRVIERAPAVFGKAGRTPHRIREWRALLPLALAYDERHDAAELHSGYPDACRRRRDAERAREAATRHLATIPATTIQGLAVHVRRFQGFRKDNIPSGWTALLQGAALVTGTELTLREAAPAPASTSSERRFA